MNKEIVWRDLRRPVVLFLLFVVVSTLWAAGSGDQVVTFSVNVINEISVSGNPGPLVVSAAAPGAQPNEAIDTTTTYAISSNGTNMKITGSINSAMPPGLTLKIRLAAPTGASSAGDVVLDVNAKDLVFGATKVAESGKSITYTLNATVAAGVVATANKTVTLTVTNGS